MSGFPINLDLCEYFDDLRKYSSIFVNLSKCKNVRDVESHIKSVFGLEDNICLVYKKFLIPKSEDIEILQQYDLFKVQKCNFYDLQIHKAKKINTSSACDQKALNLTQSEKTIDLSCRPKQRLKASICPSPGVSGSLSLFDHKNCSDSQIRTSDHASLLNGNDDIPKEKPRHKKKRHFLADDSDDDGDILDMSVKNCKGKKHKNCFSTDDGSNVSDGAFFNHCKDKKHKKRKKNSEDADDTSLDLASTCWESLVNVKEENFKKKSKKIKEHYSTDCFSTDANRISVKNVLECTVNSDENHPVDDKFSIRKKHKHSKIKNEDTKSPHGSEENQYYLSSQNFTAKTNNYKKFCISKIFDDASKQENNSESKTLNLEENKQNLNEKVDKMLLELHENSGSNTQNNNGDAKSSAFSSSQSTSDYYNFEENHVESGVVANTIQETDTLTEDKIQRPKKRKRKHKSKKKRVGLSYLLAVGPTISQLTAQPLTKSSSPPDMAKHVFFTEDDFEDDMSVPVTPPVRSQTKDLSQHTDSNAGVTQSEQNSSSKPITWQDQLLKLASSGSKPVVFHRNTTPSHIMSSKQPHCSTPTLDPNTSNGNPLDRSVLMNPTADVPRCNGEVSSDNNKEDLNHCSGTAEGCSPKKGLPDICKPLPIPNDLQNINLDDYPIIDKVRAEDLILFKVWKLNEHSEPGHSKPILAKVIETSYFPDRISLQIIEGCEECSHCTQSDSSVDSFTIELRWPDVLEPRLFYP